MGFGVSGFGVSVFWVLGALGLEFRGFGGLWGMHSGRRKYAPTPPLRMQASFVWQPIGLQVTRARSAPKDAYARVLGPKGLMIQGSWGYFELRATGYVT